MTSIELARYRQRKRRKAPQPRPRAVYKKKLEKDITREYVTNVLDEMINFWRESEKEYSEYYVDALQSARKNLIGETLGESDE